MAASGEPLDAEGKMECFFKVFDQRRCRVSRDIEIFPIRIDAKIHCSLVGGTDDTGDAVLLTFIETFRQDVYKRQVLTSVAKYSTSSK